MKTPNPIATNTTKTTGTRIAAIRAPVDRPDFFEDAGIDEDVAGGRAVEDTGVD